MLLNIATSNRPCVEKYWFIRTQKLFFQRRKIENMQQMKEVKLIERKVTNLMVDKKRLVEVPHTPSLSQTMGALVANKVLAVPVAAPPGQWIGAGGSMIVESDKQTGAVGKHYIGMVTMLDIVAHIAGDDHISLDDDGIENLDEKMSASVSSVIGHCLEGLSLWTLNPNTSLLDCMEVFSKGVHRALVPVDSHMGNVSVSGGVELIESSSGYQMLTQMDVLRFLNEHGGDELKRTLSRSVEVMGADTEKVYAITERTRLIDAIKCLKAAMLNAVPIVIASELGEDDHKQLVNGRCRKLVGTFSATDLRGCYFDTLKSWLGKSAIRFTEEIATQNTAGASERELVSCNAESPLSEVIEKAVTKHVHRVWVVDKEGLLVGIVSLSDIIRVIRASLLAGADPSGKWYVTNTILCGQRANEGFRR